MKKINVSKTAHTLRFLLYKRVYVDERSSPASAEKRGRLREEVELHAVKHDQQVAMQDSNAYGVLPGAKNARDDSETCDYLNDSPAYARVRVITSS